MNSVTAENAPTVSSVTQKHEQLKDILANLVELNNHAFQVAQALGVPMPIETPSDVKQVEVPTDNLVDVLNMMPDAAGVEITKVHDMLANISQALR